MFIFIHQSENGQSKIIFYWMFILHCTRVQLRVQTQNLEFCGAYMLQIIIGFPNLKSKFFFFVFSFQKKRLNGWIVIHRSIQHIVDLQVVVTSKFLFRYYLKWWLYIHTYLESSGITTRKSPFCDGQKPSLTRKSRR
jgi:hypothetical protein